MLTGPSTNPDKVGRFFGQTGREIEWRSRNCALSDRDRGSRSEVSYLYIGAICLEITSALLTLDDDLFPGFEDFSAGRVRCFVFTCYQAVYCPDWDRNSYMNLVVGSCERCASVVHDVADMPLCKTITIATQRSLVSLYIALDQHRCALPCL